MDIGSILVNQQFAVPVTLYDTEKLQADLSAGVANVMAGVGGAHVLDIDTGQGFALFRHTAAVYDAPAGTGYTGDLRCALGITSNGLMAGFNRKSDGAWVNSLVIDATTGSATFTGAINAESGNFTGTVTAGAIIAGSVTIAGASGNTTLDDIIAASGSYTTSDLEADLAAGIGKVVAGTGSDYRLTVDPANGFIVAGRNGSVFKGTAATGVNRPALGISANGIAMGYNRSSDGLWVDGVAIDASGNASFRGSINATSGNFTGTVTAGSVITSSVTVDGTTLATIKSGAAAGATALQSGALANLIDRTATTTLTGVINPSSSGAIKIGSITWNTSTGAWVSGSGFAITDKGIIASAGSGYTMSITNAGAAKFKGDITGSNGTFAGTVSASNITGGTLSAGISISTDGYVVADGNGTSTFGITATIAGRNGVWGGKAIYGVGTTGGATGVHGQSTSGGTGVIGESATGIGGTFSGGSYAINCYGKFLLGSTGSAYSAVLREEAGLIRMTDRYSGGSDAYMLMIKNYGTGSGPTATLGAKLGTNTAMAGWMTCTVLGVTVYVPYWT